MNIEGEVNKQSGRTSSAFNVSKPELLSFIIVKLGESELMV